jgi:hypothetical protein
MGLAMFTAFDTVCLNIVPGAMVASSWSWIPDCCLGRRKSENKCKKDCQLSVYKKIPKIYRNVLKNTLLQW